MRADLLDDAGWAAAADGCDYVLHVASPVHPGHVADENDLIVPAVEGTLRVLRAARDAGVKRVVLTSAFHTVGFGHPHTGHTFTEDDWSVMHGPGMDAYGRSKVLAERAAWDFPGVELTVLLPVAVMGPAFGGKVSGANHIVQRMITGQMTGFPDMYVPIVDVRDVAAAHVTAMTAPGAAGERVLLANGQPLSMAQIAAVLQVEGRRVPDLLVRLAALVKPEFRSVAGELGHVKKISGAKARRVLGWQPRPAEEAILAAAASMKR
ncbi:NAD-dependent epimerase/dehydratase family protein [Actinoplanes derwentensis]|uniref:NAD dependent epimerase/dehydratase family protein n=1 Tax=Actinoplanes derwentensis TaxID=113562 RepID=A0A1H1WXA1_9ACTN|nr:NAD-dependent epimerase/dehydratase family protein [Actinoplanes derwentensis]GID90497.1 dihydroflavonol-4-reductase [Actinoplanes derwentensis]SDT01704.1 NAD dependent epimerase/dehydratase family protein [Actinoplanes derwentensis]